MIIHLVRHAEAVDRSPEIQEEHRFLTANGRTVFRKAAKSLAKLPIAPDFIISSPLVRAVQTADILAEKIKFKGDLLLSSHLAPGFRSQQLHAIMAEHPHAHELALVGHEPDLGVVVAELLQATSACTLKKGMVVTVKMGGGDREANFVHLVTPGGKVVTSVEKALERLQGAS